MTDDELVWLGEKLERAREVIRSLAWAAECARDNFPPGSGSYCFFNGARRMGEDWEVQFDKQAGTD